MLEIYGIKNCDTMKKALSYLQDNHFDFIFHDYKKITLSDELLEEWYSKVGDDLLNKRGTTWRKLSDEDKEKAVASKAHLLTLLKEHTSMIKRPLLINNNEILLGFSEESYATFLKK